MPQKIVIIQRRLTHYRVALFESLRNELCGRGLELVLAYGQGTAEEIRKNDSADITWAAQLPTKYFLGGRICYQPLNDLCADAALLVVTQENKLVCNLWHQFSKTPYKVAFWGHGANLQGQQQSWRERFKRLVAAKVDWWFGYTELTRPRIKEFGFPDDRVTILNNAVDTQEMRQHFDGIDTPELQRWANLHGLRDGPIGIFLGSFYSEKRIEFLLDAARHIRHQVPDFQLLLVGAGPQKAMVEAFCKENPWAHFAGMLKGREKVLALASSTVMLNPGLVGLGILDSFVCEVPMLTTDCGLHSPEIVYLEPGINGLITANTMDDYVRESVALLHDSERLSAMKLECRRSAAEYTVENMARHFADGVEQCLQSPGYRGAVRK
ncbi:MAG: glycosyltransferase family 4 protein [Rhodoferax sp.]|uniref:glycosyltransferase family 4 protein n=1 Tax=Rhodoferax sp. TaxID=50421 RepID=UPI002ACDBF1A|nr:glycosyltransferase family 4 protein [Rhodoferax sp.]MDZ7891341.1 glycosyltransferase family 4 protein [Rhodoferax sp.]